MALDPCGRAVVKRDMELIRKILLEVEGWPNAEHRTVKLPEHEQHVVLRHVEMLCSAGLLEMFGSPRPIGTPNQFLIIKDLSWEGHEFLDAVKSDTVWNNVKQSLSAANLTSVSMETIKYAAVEISKCILRAFLGGS